MMRQAHWLADNRIYARKRLTDRETGGNRHRDTGERFLEGAGGIDRYIIDPVKHDGYIKDMAW